MTTDFNIMDYKIDQLQLRNGNTILGMFKSLNSVLVIYKKKEADETCSIHVRPNGRYNPLDGYELWCDVVLKDKPKVLVAPYYCYDSDYPHCIKLSTVFLTEDKAQKERGFIKWERRLGIEVDDND